RRATQRFSRWRGRLGLLPDPSSGASPPTECPTSNCSRIPVARLRTPIFPIGRFRSARLVTCWATPSPLPFIAPSSDGTASRLNPSGSNGGGSHERPAVRGPDTPQEHRLYRNFDCSTGFGDRREYRNVQRFEHRAAAAASVSVSRQAHDAVDRG